MISNPGYQGTHNFNLQMGQQLPRNSNSNADELLLRVTERMKNQVGLKLKGKTFSYKCPYKITVHVHTITYRRIIDENFNPSKDIITQLLTEGLRLVTVWV